jgi:hypothetical protein
LERLGERMIRRFLPGYTSSSVVKVTFSLLPTKRHQRIPTTAQYVSIHRNHKTPQFIHKLQNDNQIQSAIQPSPFVWFGYSNLDLNILFMGPFDSTHNHTAHEVGNDSSGSKETAHPSREARPGQVDGFLVLISQTHSLLPLEGLGRSVHEGVRTSRVYVDFIWYPRRLELLLQGLGRLKHHVRAVLDSHVQYMQNMVFL